MLRAVPAFLLLWHGPVSAAALTSGSAPAVPWVRLLLSLMLCLALAGGAIALLRRHQRSGLTFRLPGLLRKSALAAPARLKILETRRASQHADLCLAELDGEAYFLALTPGGVTVLNRTNLEAQLISTGEGA